MTSLNTKDMVRLISSTLNHPAVHQEGIELEARFGEYHGKRFINGIKQSQFFDILNQFQSSTYIVAIEQEILKNTKNRNGDMIYEQLYNVETPKGEYILRMSYNNPSEIFFMLKKRLRNVELYDYFTRWSVSKEIRIDKQNSYGIQLDEILREENMYQQRTKKRWSFKLKPGMKKQNVPDYLKAFQPFRIDFTIMTIQNERPIYQIEIELLQEYKSVVDGNAIWNGIIQMLMYIQNGNFVYTRQLKHGIIRDYNKYFHEEIKQLQKERNFNPNVRLYNMLIKPVNVKKSFLDDPSNYAITDKADGSRRFLYISPKGIFMLFPPDRIEWMYSYGYNPRNPMMLNVQDKNLGIQNIMNTIFDGEYVTMDDGKKIFLAFDCMIVNNVDIRVSHTFHERYKYMEKILKNINIPFLKLKHFSFPYENNFYERCNQIWKSIPDKNYQNDGLIFNHVNEHFDFSSTVYKWKPIEMMTIDFYMKPTDKDNTYQIMVKNDKTNKLIPFQGDKSHPTSSEYTVDASTKAFIEPGQVNEFGWNFKTSSFKFLRHRPDRQEPNYIGVALSVWKDIHNPIHKSTILGEDLVPMRRYHNRIKRRMISTLEPNSYVIDIGAGRGGDILKWIDNRLNVLVVEPDKDNLMELTKRLKEQGLNKINENVYEYKYADGNTIQIHILNTIGENYKAIEKAFQNGFQRKYADAIIMFNSLTFFFKNAKTFISLNHTISRLLHPGNGKFIGMVMDGTQTKQLLIPKYDLKTKLKNMNANEIYNWDQKKVTKTVYVDDKFHINKKWKICSIDKLKLTAIVNELEMEYKKKIREKTWSIEIPNRITNNSLGNKIKIHLKDTIVSNQIEYLVDFEYLTKQLIEKGIVIKEDWFLYNEHLSTSQKKLNELYRVFRFERVTSVPTEQIEKQSIRIIKQNQNYRALYPEEKEKTDTNMVRIGTIPDNNCIFHALSRAIVKKYIHSSNEFPNDPLNEYLLKKRVIYGDKISKLFHRRYSLPLIDEDTSCNDWYELFDTYKNALQEFFQTNIQLHSYGFPLELQRTQPLYDNTVHLFIHDNTIDLLGKYRKDGTLQTIFINP